MPKAGEGVTKAFSSNLNILNLKLLPTMVGYSLEDKALTIL